jgi:decaprenylphospho-beta-D-ribofuranose 2-oxidase
MSGEQSKQSATTEVLSWGMVQRCRAEVRQPSSPEDLVEVFAEARRRGLQVALRGSGLSYGDASLAESSILLDLSRFNRLLAWDSESGVLRAEPGFRLCDLWQRTLPEAWWPPVVSGTMFTTLGGAAAMNIHGKNGAQVGPIGDHIRAFEIMLPSGETRVCSRDAHAELFHAAIGGFGVLGVFTWIELQLKRVASGLLEVEPYAVADFDETFALFDRLRETSDYLVGWHDGFATGASRGRGLVHRAIHPDDEAARDPKWFDLKRQALPPRFFGVVPKSWLWLGLWFFLNDPGMRLVNAAKFHSGKRHARGGAYRQTHAAYHFLLDYVPNWKYAYRPGGLIQFQPFLPAETARATIAEILEMMEGEGIRPYLCVSKQHRADDFLMSHGIDGWSFALDIRITKANRDGVWALTERLEELVVERGGRFYFAKDAVMRPRSLERAFGAAAVSRFRELKTICDPDDLLTSDLYRRVFARD